MFSPKFYAIECIEKNSLVFYDGKGDDLYNTEEARNSEGEKQLMKDLESDLVLK
jgi:hypothetical protein